MVEPNFYEIMKLGKTDHKQEPHVKAIGLYHVSATTKCIRQQYYQHFLETKYDDATKLIFKAGEEIHKQMKDAILISYPDAVFEDKVEVELSSCSLQGHIDVVVPNQFLVEIKSTSWPKKEPEPQHVVQLNSYLIMKKMEVGYLVYIPKNTLIPKQFKIIADKALWKKTVARVLKLHGFLKAGELPPAEFWHIEDSDVKDGRSWFCKNCFYRNDCIDNRNLSKTKELKLSLEIRSKIEAEKVARKAEKEAE